MTSNPPQSGNQGQSTPTPASTKPASPQPPTQAATSYATNKSATGANVSGLAQNEQHLVNEQLMPTKPPPASGVTIVNGAPADDTRNSVTITPIGLSGIPPNGNGAPTGSGRPKDLQFGSNGSPSMGAAAAVRTNPRVTSPRTSPSPIPQQASSGGRLPSTTYQGQGNMPSFGSFGGDTVDANANAPTVHGSHMRRRPSQSHQDGRGRGYSQSGYQGGPQQMPYSPNPGFRQTPNQPRGGPNMTPQFHGNQGRPMAPYSPHQANRSPALASVNPATPNMGHVPMTHPNMPPQPYGYGQPTYNPAFDPNNHGYYPYYMAPPSPQPRAAGMPYNNTPQYMGPQYPAPIPQAAPLSRTPSQVSTDRPGSSLGQGSAPTGHSGPAHTHAASRSSNSPAPKPHFVIPAKKSPIVIKDPNSGSVKTFESPARATPSPVKISTPPTSTPPPINPSAAGHPRSESKVHAVKTDEEKKQELKDAVRMKIQQDEAAQKQRLADEASKSAEAESTPVKKDDTETACAAIEDLSIKEKAASVEEPKKDIVAVEPKKTPTPAPAPPADDEIDFDAIEREMAEIEAKERAAEEDYNRKKAEKKAEAERKEREERESYEANMKKAEAEAEARELAREAARANGESTSTDNNELFASLKKGGFTATETSTADTSVSDMGPPAKPVSAAPKKPANLKLDTPKPTEPLQPTAGMKSLENAKFLVDLSKVTYPSSINPPNAALNHAAPEGRKFHYDRDFLLQFQAVFREKISVDWDARLRDTVGDPNESSRPQSARTPSMGSRNPSRGGISNFPMGGFVAPRPGSGPIPAMGGASMGRTSSGFNFGRGGPAGMGLGNMRTGSGVGPRTGSKGGRNDSKAGGRSKAGARKDEEQNKSMPLTAGMDLKAIQTTATGWKPRSVGQSAAGPAPGGDTHMAPDVVQRKVKAALNKMTPEKFDRIAGQILEIVSQSKDESDGRTLRQVIQLTFEKATDEAHWAPMYAKFCKSMLESMSADIRDENIRDRNGTVVAGGSLFRKYLLNRCQEEFERGWKVNLPEKSEGVAEEAAMMSDEYYIAAAAKRRGLGLVKFIGELYKLGMLTERIMHECVKKLVDYDGVPDEAEVESLTSLLRTIGASLDASEKGPAMMDAYFARIELMKDTPQLPSRLQFMLLDIIDLRAAGWKSKEADKGPQTIHEIREAAARDAQAAEAERQRQASNRGGGGRLPMGRGDARFGYGQQAPPHDYASSKVGSDDLRRLRATRNPNQPMSFGPSSLLGSRTNSGRKNLGPGGNLVRGSDDSAASSRTGTPPAGKKEDHMSSSINAFSALAALEDRDNMATSPPSDSTSPMLTKAQPAVERRPSKTPSVKDGEPTA